MFPGGLACNFGWNSRENLKLKLRCVGACTSEGVFGSLAADARARGTRLSSVAERTSVGVRVSADVLDGMGLKSSSDDAVEAREPRREVLLRDLDRFLEVPIILRRKPLSPVSCSFSSRPKSFDADELGRVSISITCDRVEFRFQARLSTGADGVGRMPSNERKELGGTCVSVRTIKRRRPGAGWPGAVDGGRACLNSACSLCHMNEDQTERRR